MSTDQVIHLEKVNKWYDDFHVLKDIDLIVNKGQKIVICGPSGSGKSTMIRCINRLEAHQKGTIVVHGTELTNDLKNIDFSFCRIIPLCLFDILFSFPAFSKALTYRCATPFEFIPIPFAISFNKGCFPYFFEYFSINS